MDDKVNYWLELAEYDIETAKAMLSTGRYLYVGFICHQVIEKTIKAAITKLTQEAAPRSHNLSILARTSGLYDKMSEEQKDLLDLLEPLNVEARYPTDKERIMKSLTLERCKKILSQTEEMRIWIVTQL
ncbi:HEPN domain-containing protein [Cohnella fermenti]|uniref:HEPN domain-containing protein n=1 Tax=Cohnella fermenti TaxID=2565925 RepID=A0A4S4C9F4_9BACL|nr:HEPN domain-containing protein [Cohnella fermenti]THF84689.1 HEPN domain-containing protein [Cohnella fermenti]